MGGGRGSRSESENINSDQMVHKVALTVEKSVGNSTSEKGDVDKNERAQGGNVLAIAGVDNNKGNVMIGQTLEDSNVNSVVQTILKKGRVKNKKIDDTQNANDLMLIEAGKSETKERVETDGKEKQDERGVID